VAAFFEVSASSRLILNSAGGSEIVLRDHEQWFHVDFLLPAQTSIQTEVPSIKKNSIPILYVLNICLAA
jgi:hypothetical protein